MLLIKNAKIYPVVGKVLETGQMLINNGKIIDIGSEINAPKEAVVIDLEGKVITPGFIDMHSHVGVWGDGEGRLAYDGNEDMQNPITPNVNAIDATNPKQISFAGAREAGITTLQILPGSGNVIGGLGFICKSYGEIIDSMVVKNPSGLKAALGGNPKIWHGRRHNHAPTTRMGTAGLIREYFQEVKQYIRNKEKANEKSEYFKPDSYYEPGVMVLEKKIPFRVHAIRHDDIVTAIRLCEELDVNYSIEHCTDGHLIKDLLANKNATVSLGPGLSSAGGEEIKEFTDAEPAILHKAGVKVCLMTDHPFLNCRHFLAYGAVSSRYSISFEDTLKMMTINPAKALEIEDRVGSLEAGKDADFLIFDGHPFDYTTKLESTFIEGKKVYQRKQY
jgi:imidazolonepropionase-like amidohydrolase